MLRAAIVDASARGNLVVDAQIVALCREHGATTLLSEDRDLRRFDGITVLLLDAPSDRRPAVATRYTRTHARIPRPAGHARPAAG